MERHAGIIRLDHKLLAKFLDFEGAVIHRIYTSYEFLDPVYSCVVMEHPDLPIVAEYNSLTVICPTMQVYYGEDGCLLKTERIEPVKDLTKVKIPLRQTQNKNTY